MWANFRYRLEPPELEARFRAEGLKRDARVAEGLMLVGILFYLVTLSTDFWLVGPSRELYVLWTVRGVGVALALGSILLVRRARSVAYFDNIVMLWVGLLLAGIVLGNALLPADYTMYVAWDVFLALTVYTVVPLSIDRQVILASIITVGSIMVFWQLKTPERPAAPLDLLTAFLCANLIGAFSSWELQRWRRREFHALHREAEARSGLERARIEIRTLRGILPICAACKRIRTDEGHWQPVEVYVRDHSDADFSHGICPECSQRLYPEDSDDDPGSSP